SIKSRQRLSIPSLFICHPMIGWSSSSASEYSRAWVSIVLSLRCRRRSTQRVWRYRAHRPAVTSNSKRYRDVCARSRGPDGHMSESAEVSSFAVCSPSKGELGTQHDGIESAADRSAEWRPCDPAAGRGRKPLVDAAVQVVEHEPHIRVRIPVHPGLIDGLLAAADRVAAGRRRDARGEIVVQVDRADSPGQL